MMKRLFDLVVSFVALLVLSPVIICIYSLVWYKLGRPCIFVQARPGLNGKVFNMYKFRSMLNAADKKGVEIPDEQRLTSFGIKLRDTSLDELPGIWNILKGDMSLVGPRPLLTEYLPLYNQEQARRHDVKPGITGWAQVNGRNALSWEEKFKLDIWYIENRSFYLDLKIILMTVKKVLAKEDIHAHGEVTMSKFTGTNDDK